VTQEGEFRGGLKDGGYTQSVDVEVLYRPGNSQFDDLPGKATELAGRAAVIVVSGGTTAAVRAKMGAAGAKIVFVGGFNPVSAGLVPDLQRPGGNITGIHLATTDTIGERFELARELVPGANHIAALVASVPDVGQAETDLLQKAASAAKVQLSTAQAKTTAELTNAFDTFVSRGAKAVVVAADPFFMSARDHLIGLAASKNLPTVYSLREYVEAGGLASNGPSLAQAYRMAGDYAAKILKGQNPGQLPVLEAPRKLVIQRAAATRFNVPSQVLSRAEVIG
jgi:putative ABC transport system substrate-binding protein